MKKTSFLLFVVALFIATIAFSQEEKGKAQFKFDVNFLGNAAFYNYCGFSIFTPQEHVTSYGSINFAVKWERVALSLGFDGYGGNMIYSNGIKETNSLANIKINFETYTNINDRLLFSLYVGGGFLFSHLNPSLSIGGKTYDLKTRIGGSANVGIALYYHIVEKLFVNIKAGSIAGKLKSVSLPNELSIYKNDINNNFILSNELSLGLTFLF
ncbi:MAG: hypothetical protein LBM25_07900 [Bacteroidales bacterium]|jgi:hypothetical protein|nr:hypothetical protein [Bacteroidales bacterium]